MAVELVAPILPRNATPEDLARNYANLTGQLVAKVREMDNDLVDTKAAAIAGSAAGHRAESKVDQLLKEFGTIKEALAYFTTFLDKVKERAEAVAKETASKTATDVIEENTGRFHTVLFHAAMDAAKESTPVGGARRSDPARAIDSALDKRELEEARRTRERVWALVIGAGSIGVWELGKLIFSLAHH